LPGALDAVVKLPFRGSKTTREPQVVSTYVRTYDEAEAKKATAQLIELLNEALPDVGTPFAVKQWRHDDPETFQHNLYTIGVRDIDVPTDTGLGRELVLHQIQVTFKGIPPAAADVSRVPTTPGTTAGDIAKLMDLADSGKISTLEGAYDSEVERWDSKFQPLMFKGCSIAKIDPDVWMSCSKNYPSMNEAIAVTKELSHVTVSLGATVKRVTERNGGCTVDLTSQRGSKIHINASASGSKPEVFLSVHEWQP
jgi:hypothetical protein